MSKIERIEHKLGFNKIRSAIESRCSTNLAAKKADEFSLMTDKSLINKALSEVDEMKTIQMLESGFPNDGYVDTVDFLKQLEVEYSYIDLHSVIKLRQSLDATAAIIRFFKNSKEDRYPALKELTSSIVLFPEITRRIDVIVDRHGDIRDSASVHLKSIRSSIRDKETRISGRIQAILKRAKQDGVVEEDASVTVRDGKMLIPIPSGNKRKVSGLIVDESASGKTSFIEPMEIVELNNEVRELYFAEQREILKILVEFSDFLRPYLTELVQSSYFISEIDFIRAKARVAIEMDAGKPVVAEGREIRIIKGRHPLLEKALKREGKEIVPLNLELNGERRILIISGPNAGGKSVCLKTTGILQYMFQTGMLVPASEISEFPVFTQIFVDIGDEQSLENDLSTYSSHLTNMREILMSADENSLVLVDEFGAGTEPTAGGAIAESILKELELAGCFGVITTHYSNLKFYAGTGKGVINGGMQFDVQNIQPLFKLEIGVPGSSFAFELARKIGLPQDVVKYAEERAGVEFVDLEKNLKRIAKNRRILDEKVARIRSTDKTLENITERYQKELSDIQALRKSIIAEAKEDAARLLSEANKRIESTIKDIKESQANKEITKRSRKELDLFATKAFDEQGSEKAEQIERKMEQLKLRQQRREERRARVGNTKSNSTIVVPKVEQGIKQGDRVKIEDSGLTGEVIKIEENKVSIAIGDIITRSHIKNITKISAKEYKDRDKFTKQISVISSSISERKLNFKPTIDVRGERLDEALDSVSKFIDDAIMLGMGEVKILHGKGSGVLKEELRKYLRTVPGVQSLHDEHLELGGSGITVIKLD